MKRAWPDATATGGLTSRQDAQLYKSMMWSEFKLILERVLGDNRQLLALGDELAFALLMEVVWNGATHSQTAEEKCLLEDLVERHREYVDSGALPTFLMLYPSLHYRITALVQESSINSERARLRGAARRKGA